jgi:hypothetical protein
MVVRSLSYFHILSLLTYTIAAKEGKRMVVIGSSFISMEIVAAVAKRKLASIDVIGMENYPFEAVLGKEVGQGLQKVLFSLWSFYTRPTGGCFSITNLKVSNSTWQARSIRSSLKKTTPHWQEESL